MVALSDDNMEFDLTLKEVLCSLFLFCLLSLGVRSAPLTFLISHSLTLPALLSYDSSLLLVSDHTEMIFFLSSLRCLFSSFFFCFLFLLRRLLKLFSGLHKAQ